MNGNAMITVTNRETAETFTMTYRTLLQTIRTMIDEGTPEDRYTGIQLLDDLYRL